MNPILLLFILTLIFKNVLSSVHLSTISKIQVSIAGQRPWQIEPHGVIDSRQLRFNLNNVLLNRRNRFTINLTVTYPFVDDFPIDLKSVDFDEDFSASLSFCYIQQQYSPTLLYRAFSWISKRLKEAQKEQFNIKCLVQTDLTQQGYVIINQLVFKVNIIQHLKQYSIQNQNQYVERNIKAIYSLVNDFERMIPFPGPFLIDMQLKVNNQNLYVKSNPFCIQKLQRFIKNSRLYGNFQVKVSNDKYGLKQLDVSPQSFGFADYYAKISRKPLFFGTGEEISMNTHLQVATIPDIGLDFVKSTIKSNSQWNQVKFHQFHHKDKQRTMKWGVRFQLNYIDQSGSVGNLFQLDFYDNEAVDLNLQMFNGDYDDIFRLFSKNEIPHENEFTDKKGFYQLIVEKQFTFKILAVVIRVNDQKSNHFGYPNFAKVRGNIYIYRIFYKCISTQCPESWLFYDITYKSLSKISFFRGLNKFREINSQSNLFALPNGQMRYPGLSQQFRLTGAVEIENKCIIGNFKNFLKSLSIHQRMKLSFDALRNPDEDEDQNVLYYDAVDDTQSEVSDCFTC